MENNLGGGGGDGEILPDHQCSQSLNEKLVDLASMSAPSDSNMSELKLRKRDIKAARKIDSTASNEQDSVEKRTKPSEAS